MSNGEKKTDAFYLVKPSKSMCGWLSENKHSIVNNFKLGYFFSIFFYICSIQTIEKHTNFFFLFKNQFLNVHVFLWEGGGRKSWSLIKNSIYCGAIFCRNRRYRRRQTVALPKVSVLNSVCVRAGIYKYTTYASEMGNQTMAE